MIQIRVATARTNARSWLIRQARGAVFEQLVFEHVLSVDVEMIGRLVEKVEVRLDQPQQQHRKSCPLPARQAGQRRDLGVDAYPRSGKLRPRLMVAEAARPFDRLPWRREVIKQRQRLVGIADPEARRSSDIRVRYGKGRPQSLDQ